MAPTKIWGNIRFSCVNTTTAGVVVTLVAMTVSLPVGLATAGFFVVSRIVEDYVLVPRIIGRAVKVPALLTVVGGHIVYAAGLFAAHDNPPPPAMPDWSPARTFGGYAGWADTEGAPLQATLRQAAAACACATSCGVHGHQHAKAWTSKLPISDLKGFWGALGCACWAI